MNSKQIKQSQVVLDHSVSDNHFGYHSDRRRENHQPLSHLMRTFVLIAVLVMSVGNVWGQDVTFTFNGSTEITDGNQTTITQDGATISLSGATIEKYKELYMPHDGVVITITPATDKKIVKVVVNYDGEKTFNYGNTQSTDDNKTATNSYEWKPSLNKNAAASIRFVSKSSSIDNRVWLKSIQVYYGQHVDVGVSITSPSSNNITVLAGQKITLNASPTGGEEGAFAEWRTYSNANPSNANAGTHFAYGYTEYTVPETADTYYIGANANQNCAAGNGYEQSAPSIVTLNVVEGYTVTYNANNPDLGSVTATANGQTLTSGSKVLPNTDVTFTATPSGDNLFYNWYDGTSTDYSTGATKTVTVTGDLTMTADFEAGVYVYAHTNDETLGTVTATCGGNNGSTIHLNPWPGAVAFTATAVNNGVFEGWYKSNEFTAENRVSDYYVYNTPTTEGDEMRVTNQKYYNLYANFVSGVQVNVEVSPAGIAPAITIHQKGHEDWTITNHQYVQQYTTAVFHAGDVDGYTFDGWYKGGVKIDDAPQNEYDFGNVTSDLTLTAKYESTSAKTGLIDAKVGERNYQVYVPSGITSATVPVVFTLHGRGNDYKMNGSGGVPDLHEQADADKFIVVSPQGVDKVWNAYTDKSNSTEMAAYNVDYEFLKQIITNLSSTTSSNPTYNSGNTITIDKTKVYAVGFSNGGMMAYALVTNHPDVFAAGGSVSGIPVNQYALHKSNGHPVPFIHFHGKSDGYVKYDQVEQHLQNWAAYNGCGTKTVTGNIGKSASGDCHVSYAAGAGNVPFEFYGISGAGHQENMKYDGNTSGQIIWNFLKGKTLGGTAVDMTVVWKPAVADLNAQSSRAWGGQTDQYVSGGKSDEMTVNQGVIDRICLDKGKHQLRFTASSTVKIKLYKTGAASSLFYKKNTVNNSETVFDFDVTEAGDYVVEISYAGSSPFSDFGIYKLDLPIESTILKDSNTPTFENGVAKYTSIQGGQSVFKYTNVDFSNYTSITTSAANITGDGGFQIHNTNSLVEAIASGETTTTKTLTSGEMLLASHGGTAVDINYVRLNYKNTYSVGSDATSIDFYANRNNTSWGTVSISDGTNNADQHLEAESSSTITYTATANTGYRFVGWYTDAACQKLLSSTSPYTVADTYKEKGITLWAKFANGSTFSPEANLNFDCAENTNDLSHGGNVNWTYNSSATTATLKPTGASDNYVGVKEVTGHGSEYNGVEIKYNGQPFRIIVRYTDGVDSNNEPIVKQIIKEVDGASVPTTSFWSWSMLGVPSASRNNITVIRLAGKQDWTADYSNVETTIYSVVLKNYDVPASATKDDGYVKFNLDSRTNVDNDCGYWRGSSDHISWVVKNEETGSGTEKLLAVKNNNNSNNFMEVFNFSDYAAKDYTGVLIDSKGSHVRVIATTSDGKTFEYTTESSDVKISTHIDWDEFHLQDGATAMTSEDIANINKVAIAGCRMHTGDESFDVYKVWLDKLHSNSIETTIANATVNGTNLIYTDANNVKVEFDGYNSTNDTPYAVAHGNGYNMWVTAPAGYRITKVRVVLVNTPSSATTVTTLIDGTEVDKQTDFQKQYYEYTNTQDKALNIKFTNGQSVQYVTYEMESVSISELRTITSSETQRQYYIYVPNRVFNKTVTNVPVVFSVHGSNADYNKDVMNFNALADANDFIVVYPRGRELNFYGYNGGTPAIRGWEATGADNVDMQLFRDIVSTLKSSSEFSINENRIYITGSGNGGMMAFAAANVMPDVFTAYAVTSGYPVNEMHMQHNYYNSTNKNTITVPFLYMHGTENTFVKYKHVPTIIDNMLARNGQPYTTSTETVGNATLYKYEKSGKQPIHYYQVNGGGHSVEFTINGQNSKNIIWDFFNGFTQKPGTTTVEFAPQVNTATDENTMRNHGWTVNSGLILAKYGESGGYEANGENTYHTIQLKAGQHSIKFNAKNGDETKKVIVRLNKLGTLANFDHMPASSAMTRFTTTSDNIIKNGEKERAYYCGNSENGAAIAYTFTTDEDAEYELEILKGDLNDKTTISNIEIVSGSVDASGNPAQVAATTDFTGWYNYNNRLGAQWNFDQCDAYRFNTYNIANGYWVEAANNMNTYTKTGDISYTYTKAIGNVDGDLKNENNFSELTYDGNVDHKIPVLSGLKFNAPANTIQVKVTYNNGVAKGVHLVVGNGVNMLIPYVENTYRADSDTDPSKQGAYNQATQPVDGADEGTVANQANFENCVHHWKRDILYVSVEEGSIDNHYKNKCLDIEGLQMFGPGGNETVNGVYFEKLNYTGTHGVPCVMRFTKTTSFNRIGVNRNLTYSFYPEYITELNLADNKPLPRTRIIGSPNGLAVANIPGLNKYDYSNAIAFTFGGWKNNQGGYSYQPYTTSGRNSHNNPLTEIDGKQCVTDNWTSLGVYSGGAQFMTWDNMTAPTGATTNDPIASDGFPVLTMNRERATSGSLMPEGTATTETLQEDAEDGSKVTVPNYHPGNPGNLYVGDTYPYKANITPWSLPVRGGYLKFEPSIPGVLNVHIGMQAGKTYFIADEFGVLQTASDVFVKNASSNKHVVKVDAAGNEVSLGNSYGFKLVTPEVTANPSAYDFDYVKFSFNVYPGKTYYMFSNETGMAFAGFYYEPFVNRHDVNDEFGRWDVGVDEATLNAGADDPYVFPTLTKANTNGGVEVIKSPKVLNPSSDSDYENYDIHYSKKAVKVTLKRSFKANTWNTICLPYSMNQVQMEKVFGEGTRVVLLRDLQAKKNTTTGKNTLTLICHENQDILAGYPYFILPTQNVDNVVSYACLDKFPSYTGSADAPVPSLVTVKSNGPNTNFYATEKDYYTYQGIDQFTMRGTFQKTFVRDGSYYVGSGRLKKQTSPEGREEQGFWLNPYRAWIDLNANVDENGALFAKKVEFIDGMPGDVEEDKSTDIDDIDINDLLEQQGVFVKKSTVYGLDGRVVRANAENLNNLPKGIYIVNGKKYLVK